MSKCYICPRECGADRAGGEIGICRAPSELLVAKTMLHKWEEPCISGHGGAGTVFFSGCNLHCLYCQNCAISNGQIGRALSDEELCQEIFTLVNSGAECIELVTPTHYTENLADLLTNIKPRLSVPVVWNSSGYEKARSLKMLDGLVDVYLPDFKYFGSEIANNYSSAPDYAEVALSALEEMLSQTGKPQINSQGILQKGVLVRHLVLPSHRADSIAVLNLLAEKFGPDSLLLSLMSQYTPDFYIGSGSQGNHKPLCRRVTSFEYNSVMKAAQALGFDGYFQAPSSADKQYTPDFIG